MKQGKTTLALFLCRQFSPGIVVWDPRHMIDYGAVFVDTPGELQEAIDDERWLAGPIIYRPGMDPEEDFDAMCSVLFSPPERYRHWALLIDEASQLQRPQSINQRLDQAVRQHPRSVLIVQTTHSLQDWHRASKDLMSQLYCFRMQGRSLDAVIDYVDGDDELREVIRTLPDHWCVRYNFEAMQGEPVWEVWDNPKLWFTPLQPIGVMRDGHRNRSGEEGERTA
jgi:hypothetical protein